MDDGLTLYKGPLKDKEGKEVSAAGQIIDNEDTKSRLGVRFFGGGAIGKTGLN